MPGSQPFRNVDATPTPGVVDTSPVPAPAPSRHLFLTTLRVPLNFGVSISGRGIIGRRLGLYDYWFEPDELDEPAVFRRVEDSDRLVRILFPERLDEDRSNICRSFAGSPEGLTPPGAR